MEVGESGGGLGQPGEALGRRGMVLGSSGFDFQGFCSHFEGDWGHFFPCLLNVFFESVSGSIFYRFGKDFEWFSNDFWEWNLKDFRMTKTMKIIKNSRFFEDFTGCESIRWVMKIFFFVPCLFIWFGPLWNPFFLRFWRWFCSRFECDFHVDFGYRFLGWISSPWDLKSSRERKPTNAPTSIRR